VPVSLCLQVVRRSSHPRRYTLANMVEHEAIRRDQFEVPNLFNIRSQFSSRPSSVHAPTGPLVKVKVVLSHVTTSHALSSSAKLNVVTGPPRNFGCPDTEYISWPCSLALRPIAANSSLDYG
jgi:hypothetical protein